jgi:hypothetical protein
MLPMANGQSHNNGKQTELTIDFVVLTAMDMSSIFWDITPQ